MVQESEILRKLEALGYPKADWQLEVQEMQSVDCPEAALDSLRFYLLREKAWRPVRGSAYKGFKPLIVKGDQLELGPSPALFALILEG